MKKVKNLIVGIFAAIVMSGCMGCSTVEPNYEGVLMSSYGKNGKSDFKKVTGTNNTIWFGTSLYQVPMFEQKGNPDKIDITAKDGGVFTVDPQFTYSVKRDSGVNVIFSYKYLSLSGKLDEDDLDNIESAVLNPIVLNAYREEARKFASDSLLTNVNGFENNVEERLKQEFSRKYFNITSLSSGLRPPQSMTANIERMNNAKVETQTVSNQLATATMLKKKAQIDAETNEIRSKGFTREVLAEKWIDAIRHSQNRIIITDGKTPVIVQ